MSELPARAIGIIPARAGFTLDERPHRVPGEDHPRSRGVYGRGRADSGRAGGSSPLARGLLSNHIPSFSGRWIIPARAGFTRRRAGTKPGRRDHPRSRGVYHALHVKDVNGDGSSPLARGLLVLSRDDSGEPGIIPARAGFTARPRRTRAARGDHPRSRGVYPEPSRPAARLAGSSPLARGLRAPSRAARAAARIIPARAGFTVGGGAFPLPRGDHPRSRGVYDTNSVQELIKCGSSPLARGLRRRRRRARVRAGIIPARAGFTAALACSSFVWTDHPRSRGVYQPRIGAKTSLPGSSPLARGLLSVRCATPCAPRIIPARAGFTRRSPREWRPDADHPRSRGVYSCTDTNHAAGLRIIPARAGFTALAEGVRHAITDHPRSRGVYLTHPGHPHPGMGSSPLARGLRTAIYDGLRDRRIIPARAGFTCLASLACVRFADHPRSRGVYNSAVRTPR